MYGEIMDYVANDVEKSGSLYGDFCVCVYIHKHTCIYIHIYTLYKHLCVYLKLYKLQMDEKISIKGKCLKLTREKVVVFL